LAAGADVVLRGLGVVLRYSPDCLLLKRSSGAVVDGKHGMGLCYSVPGALVLVLTCMCCFLGS
jgi:hypothetical protein